jgi:uncharacterized protein YcbX
MPTISQLFIYPVKSLGGIPLKEAQVTSRGLQYDRRWMLVDENNQFLSQRKFPQLALFKVDLLNTGLQITFTPTLSSIIVPFVPQTQERINVKVWDDECTGICVSAELDIWFSNLLSFTCRLIYMDQESIRPVDPKYAGPQHITSFADAYPMLLVSASSLNDLNNKLSEPVSIDRFRPNILIENTEPYLEDIIKHFSIDDITFYGVKPCARCVMIGVDQQTSKMGDEPLKTLSGYRKANNKVYFGQNLIHDGVGNIKVGDELVIKELGIPLQFSNDKPVA